MKRLWIASMILAIACGSSAALIEHLGQPCRAKNILGGSLVADPSGQEWLVLCNTNEASNMELIFVDFENDTGRAIKCPAGQGAWVLQEIPGDRLVVGTYYDGKHLVFDRTKMEFVKTIPVPGEEYLWDSAMGKDGRMYSGTYPHAKLAALDVNSYAVETFDRPSGSNQYLRHITPTADGRLICTYGMQNMETFVFDPGTRQFTSAPQELQKLTLAALWNGYVVDEKQAFDGTTLQRVSPLPFPVPQGNKEWKVLTAPSTSDTLLIKQENGLFAVKAGSTVLDRLAHYDERLIGGLRGMSRSGKLVGTYGQDYYAFNPKAEMEPKLKAIPVQSGGRPVHFIRADWASGVLWGGPQFGQTLFHMDLRTTAVVNTGIVSHHGGEVYDVAFFNHKVYAVSYVGGEIIEYDPSSTFDLWHGNPRTVAKVAPGYIRPTGAIMVGPDGMLYSGWMAKYGARGGAVAITNPANGDTKLIENVVPNQPVTGVARGKKDIYIGTGLQANGLPALAGKSNFLVWDPQTSSVVFKKEFDAEAVTNIILNEKSGLVLAKVGQQTIVVFDPDARQFRDMSAPPCNFNFEQDLVGNVYYGSGDSLVVIDPVGGKTLDTVKAPGRVEKVAVEKRGAALFTIGPDLYRVKF